LVVVLPLVGWLPVHPPDAVQLCASLVLHCKVAAVPMVTLLLIATKVTAGFELPAALGSELFDWPEDEDCWHAARADNAANPTTQRSSRDALARGDIRSSVVHDKLRAVLKQNWNIEWARPTEIIIHLPEHLRWRWLPGIDYRRVVVIVESHIQLLFYLCQSVAIRERVCHSRQCRGLEIDYVQRPMRERIRG
jgi:hypothetical protein